VTLHGPKLLDADHVVEGFDCGTPALNDWLVRRALTNQQSGATRTWAVSSDAERRVVGYYAAATASIVRAATTKRAARNQPEDVPAVLLARLAVDRRHAGRGLAAALLQHFVLKALEVAALVGARVLLVHAQDENARRFYLRYGFERSPVDEFTLMRVITDLTR
jgi:GNAT superfamily N-acetyltransferase